MYWKMSIDLDRPQVRSMGHHDPLEGYVACAQLAATAADADRRVRPLARPGRGGAARATGLREDLVGFWSETANRDNRTFSEHRDINEVMLASALVPDAVLVLP